MIDVAQSPELKAVILTMKTAPSRVRSEMRKAARKELNAIWKPELERRATTRLQKRVLVQGARAKVGSDSFTMLAATSRRKLRGGLVPDIEPFGVEFGATPKRVTVRYRGRNRSQIINRQFAPRRKKGYVVYPAARSTGPRIVAGWVRGAVTGLINSTEMDTV